MRFALLAMAVVCVACPAGQALSAFTDVVPAGSEPLLDERVNVCLAALDLGQFVPVSVGTNARVALQGTSTWFQPLCAPYPVKDQKVGGSIEPKVVPSGTFSLPTPIVSWSVELGLCPLGFESVTVGSLSCSTAFIPVDASGLGDRIFLSDLDLPYSGFVRACYDAAEYDPVTGAVTTLEVQDHFMAVTWDDLNNDQPLAAAAVATGLDPRNWSSPGPCT